MPRSLRIEYPHALYHIMNRGRNKDNIFHDDSDFQLFLDVVRESNIKFNAIIHCYCLMSNHYHLLLETPDANLSQIMLFIGKKYVSQYNKKNNFDGPLFKSRYKAILVDKDSYLIELNRYIHRNPIHMVDNLSDYKWSSYSSYLNIADTPSWLNKEPMKQMLDCEDSLEKYRIFVESDREQEIYKGCKRIPSIVGNKDFKKKVLKFINR